MKIIKKSVFIFYMIIAVLAGSVLPIHRVYAEESVETELKASEHDLWHFTYMQVEEAWDLIDEIRPVSERTEEDKIIVATLDTGIAVHEDLYENVDRERCVTVVREELEQEPSEEVVIEYKKYETTVSSHGTNIAGIIAATSYNGIGTAGIASGHNNDLIRLMGINVFRSDVPYEDQGDASTEDIIKGLRYACEQGAKVINMCLGHTLGDADATGGIHDDVALEEAINQAVEEYDVLIVCSAGNKKDDRAWYPSDFEAVVSTINSQEYTNAWSKDTKFKNSSYGEKKDISAPGSQVYTTKANGGYTFGQGTSSASACVSGVAALVRYVNPELSAQEVKEILYSTATDLYTDGFDIYTGFGNINAYRAVAKAAGIEMQEEVEYMPGTYLFTRSVGAAKIEVSWEPVENAGGYILYRTDKVDGVYKEIAFIERPDITTYIDSRRNFKKEYYYKIEVLGTSEKNKSKIKSELSDVASGRAVTAIPEIQIENINCSTLKVSWNKLIGADGYRIYRSRTKSGPYVKVKTVNNSEKVSWKDQSCIPGKRYFYKVQAFRYSDDGSRYWSEYSEAQFQKALPAQVTGFKVSLKRKKAKLVWKKDVDVSGYQIYRATSKNGKWKRIKTIKSYSKNSFVTKNKLKKGVTYYYKVVSYRKVNKKSLIGMESKVKATIL